MNKWFTLYWYYYLFTDLKWTEGFKHKLQVIRCRIKGHPRGPVYYTGSTTLEPDMSCKDCGDEL
jgi:hypothetical protein